MPRLRLQKFLAAAGVDSRRHCEALIQAGHVAVNGAVVTELGSSVDPEQDTVVLDGKSLQVRQPDTYLLLHKPEGYVTTAHDERGRPTVMDLLPNAAGVRLFPVGRLDQDTEGALLFTNNGELAHRLTHPSYGIEREYEALLRGTPIADGMRRLQRGAAVQGSHAAPVRVHLIKREAPEQVAPSFWVRMVLTEGRKREIREICAAAGYPVIRLRRVRYGPLRLTKLGRGACRPLTPQEVAALSAAVGLGTTVRSSTAAGHRPRSQPPHAHQRSRTR